jgi:hypothetical protein
MKGRERRGRETAFVDRMLSVRRPPDHATAKQLLCKNYPTNSSGVSREQILAFFKEFQSIEPHKPKLSLGQYLAHVEDLWRTPSGEA